MRERRTIGVIPTTKETTVMSADEIQAILKPEIQAATDDTASAPTVKDPKAAPAGKTKKKKRRRRRKTRS